MRREPPTALLLSFRVRPAPTPLEPDPDGSLTAGAARRHAPAISRLLASAGISSPARCQRVWLKVRPAADSKRPN